MTVIRSTEPAEDDLHVRNAAKRFNFAMGFDEEQENESWMHPECRGPQEIDDLLRRWRLSDVVGSEKDGSPVGQRIGKGAFGKSHRAPNDYSGTRLLTCR